MPGQKLEPKKQKLYKLVSPRISGLEKTLTTKMSQNFCLKKKTQSFDFSVKFECSVSLQASDSCGYRLSNNINKLEGSKDGRVGMHSLLSNCL